MKQINTGRSFGFPAMLAKACNLKTKAETRVSLSKKISLLSGVFMLLLGSTVNAQIAHYTATNGTATAVTYAANATGTTLTSTGLGTTTPCGSGGLSGLTNNGVTTFSTSNGHVYFTITANPGYVLNVTGYTCKLRRSGSGIQKVRMAYITTGGTVNDLIDQAPDNTGCGGGATVHSWNTTTGGALPTGVTSFTAELFPYATISSGGTIQFNDITINGTVVINPVSCPAVIAAGTVTPSSAAVCGGTNVALALTGFSTGTNITYQWQSSPNGTTWSNILSATTTSYNAISSPAVATTTYYRTTTTCTVGGASATSSNATVTVNPAPNAGAITGSLVLNTGASTTLTNPTASTGAGFASVWNSSSTSIATIDPVTALYTGVSAGNTTISNTITDLSSGCDATATAHGSIIFPGDLAIYLGSNGTSTSVVGINDETVGSISATGMGSATTCTTGGLSGLTEPTTVTSYNAATGPYVSYTITPTPGNALNVNSFWVSSRSSGSGPDMARLAYRINGGAWIDEGVDHTLSTTGSCGAHTNTWHWTPSTAINGITTNIEVAIFPYHPGTSTGTFQLQQLEVMGTVSGAAPCTATPAAGTITPASTVACLSGYASLTFAGDAGVGISYSWEADNGSGFAPIAGASNTSYVSPVYTVVPTNITYRVVTTCASFGSSNSAVSTFSVVPVPDPISGAPVPYLLAGDIALLSDVTPGGKWFSSHFSVASADSMTGIISGLIPGITEITYETAGFGCSVKDTVTVIEPNTMAVYLGTGGVSTAVTAIAPVIPTALSANGAFGTATSCSGGGLSGLTENTSISSFATANPYVGFTIAPNTAGDVLLVTAIHATVRSSATGPQLVRLAYSTDGGTTWVNNGTDLSTDVQSCGVSTVDLSWNTAFTTTNNVLVAVFPFAPTANSGTFQVNTIDVTGNVAPACGGPLGAITDEDGNPLNTLHLDDCGTGTTPLFVSGEPYGIWSSSNTAVATIDPITGELNPIAGSCPTPLTTTVSYVAYDGVSCIGTSTDVANVSLCGGGCKVANTTGVATTNKSTTVAFYPNPATSTINVVASEKVNVSVLSIDGKMLIGQPNAESINVSELASGLYIIKIYNQDNSLIKTAKFTKK